MKNRKKKHTAMTAAELAAATREYDADFAFLKARPLTSAERKLHAQARRRARPRPNPKSNPGAPGQNPKS